jgi:hypothetical protein
MDELNKKESPSDAMEKQNPSKNLCGCLVIDACGCVEDACGYEPADCTCFADPCACSIR